MDEHTDHLSSLFRDSLIQFLLLNTGVEGSDGFFKLFLFKVMLLGRHRPPLSPLASPRCRAQSVGQDRPPLAATYVVPARPSHVAPRSRSHPARAIPALLARSSPHDSPVLAPLRSHPAIPRTLPPHVAKS